MELNCLRSTRSHARKGHCRDNVVTFDVQTFSCNFRRTSLATLKFKICISQKNGVPHRKQKMRISSRTVFFKIRDELAFYRNFIKASIYQSEIESSRNFADSFDRLALLRSRPSIVTNLLKRIAILHKHPCMPARRISLEMPRRTGVTLLFY